MRNIKFGAMSVGHSLTALLPIRSVSASGSKSYRTDACLDTSIAGAIRTLGSMLAVSVSPKVFGPPAEWFCSMRIGKR